MVWQLVPSLTHTPFVPPISPCTFKRNNHIHKSGAAVLHALASLTHEQWRRWWRQRHVVGRGWHVTLTIFGFVDTILVS